MSGSNGIVKYARVNREDEIIDPKFRGTIYSQNPTIVSVTNANLSAAQMMSNLFLDATTPNALTAPLTSTELAFLSTQYLTTDGSSWTVTIHNNDPVNAKVITLPAGWTPTTVTIGPDSTSELTWVVTNGAAVPPQISLLAQVNSTSAVFSTAAAVAHDIWTYDGTQWQPTSALPANFWSEVKGLHSVGGIGLTLGSNLFETTTNATSCVRIVKTPNGASAFDNYVLDCEGLDPFGNRGQVDSIDHTIMNITAVGPVAPANVSGVTVGGYHITCETLNGAQGTVFYVTRDGIVRLTPRLPVAGSSDLRWNPVNGEVCLIACTNDVKTNIQLIDPDFIENIPNATKWDCVTDNLDRKFASEMVSDIYNNQNLTAEQKKILLDHTYLAPFDPASPYFDATKHCNKNQFPNGKFDFTRPIGIQSDALVTLVKAYAVQHITQLESSLTQAESTIDNLSTQFAALTQRVLALENA